MTQTELTGMQATAVDTRLKLSALWITTLFFFAYVDIFQHFRADFLLGVLDGEVVGTPFQVTQGFLVFTLIYVAIPSLMVAGSLMMAPSLNRRVNVAVSLLYAVTVAISMIGEEWIYYLLGSAVEIGLLLTIAMTAKRWSIRS